MLKGGWGERYNVSGQKKCLLGEWVTAVTTIYMCVK